MDFRTYLIILAFFQLYASADCPSVVTFENLCFNKASINACIDVNGVFVFDDGRTTLITNAPTCIKTTIVEVITNLFTSTEPCLPTRRVTLKDPNGPLLTLAIHNSPSIPALTSQDVIVSVSSIEILPSNLSDSPTSTTSSDQPENTFLAIERDAFLNCTINPFDTSLRLFVIPQYTVLLHTGYANEVRLIVNGSNGKVLGVFPNGTVSDFEADADGLHFRVEPTESGLFDLRTDEDTPRYLGISSDNDYVLTERSSDGPFPMFDSGLQVTVTTSIWSIDCNGALIISTSPIIPHDDDPILRRDARFGLDIELPLALLDLALLELVRAGGRKIKENPRCLFGGTAVDAEGARPVEVNGCGSFGVTVPYAIDFFRFTPCCNGHDACFDTCSTTYKGCNDVFLDCMLSRCGSVPFFRDRCFRLGAAFYGVVAGPIGFAALRVANFQRCTCEDLPVPPSSSPPKPSTTSSSSSSSSTTSSSTSTTSSAAPSTTACAILGRKKEKSFTYLDAPGYDECRAQVRADLDGPCATICEDQEYDCDVECKGAEEYLECLAYCRELRIKRCKLALLECPAKYRSRYSQCVNLFLERGQCFPGVIDACRKVRDDCKIQNNDPGLSYVHPA